MNSSALRRIWPLVAVGALLAAAVVAVSLASPSIRRVPLPIHPPSPRPLPTDSGFVAPGAARPSATGVQQPIQLGWLGTVLEFVCLGAVVVVAGILVFLLLRGSLTGRRRRLLVEAGQASPAARRDEVIAAVDAGLSDLDADDNDPRKAVIACWVRLEQAAAAAGTPREPGDTPTDLVARLLAAHEVSGPVLYPLADVYRLARYATHMVDPTMRDQARAALRQLRVELTHSRAITPEPAP